MIETWYKQDIKKPVKVQYLKGNVFSLDNNGNVIGIECYDEDQPASLTGSVSASVIRADGATVAIAGTLSGNRASVKLPQAACAVPGVISVVIKVTNGSEVSTVGAVVATVYQSSTDSTVDPGTVIPSIDALIAEIEAAIASIPADYSALWTSLAMAFNSSHSYKPGQYVTYNGGVYRFTANHTGTWNTADVASVAIGTDLYRAVKSANRVLSNNTIDSYLPSRDFNDLVNGSEVFFVSSLSGIANAPITQMTGEFIVAKYNASSAAGVLQVFFNYAGDMYFRISHGTTVVWEDWSVLSQRNFAEGSIISNNTYTSYMQDGDFNNLTVNRASYYIAGLTLAVNQPLAKMDGFFSVEKYNKSVENGYLQVFYANTGAICYRVNHGVPGVWDCWNILNNEQHKLTCRIFKKVVCCGDSYTSGYMVDPSETVDRINEEFAWPHYMSTLTGNNWVNCGHSGTNALTWQTAVRGLPKARQAGKTQAYVLGLMINDSSSGDAHLNVGTTADIGTNAQTYYAQYSKIIRELAAISPDAFIFLCTNPNDSDAEERYAPYNQAVRDICEAYKNTYKVHILDLYAYRNLYQSKSLLNDRKSGHYTAVGYEQFSEIMSVIMSDYINSNISTFQQVAFIPYDNTPTKEGIDAVIDASGTSTSINFSNTYIDAVGKKAVFGGKNYFSVVMTYKANVSSGVNSILPTLQAPQDTGVMFYEKDLAMQDTGGEGYLSYTTAWRMNGKHTAGQTVLVFGEYA